jgi:hypothetical protein
MGIRDEASLSPRERAALAGLEARAAAEDPRLADKLAGARRWQWPRPRVPAVLTGLAPLVWGPLLVVIGVAAMVVGLSVGTALGVAGAVVTAGGLTLVVRGIQGHRRPPDH